MTLLMGPSRYVWILQLKKCFLLNCLFDILFDFDADTDFEADDRGAVRPRSFVF